MQLPELPKKYNRKEASVTPLVLKWFKDNYPYSCAVEVKVGNNKILPHQLVALKEVDNGTFAYKIPDMGRKNPFDFFMLKDAKALLVTCDGHDCTATEPNGSWFKFKIKK